jgi:hypothetical protein
MRSVTEAIFYFQMQWEGGIQEEGKRVYVNLRNTFSSAKPPPVFAWDPLL